MKNKWLERYSLRKSIKTGDLVVWDKLRFNEEQMAGLCSQFGNEPLEVMSEPYVQNYCGFPYGLWIELGRNVIKSKTYDNRLDSFDFDKGKQ